MLDAERVRYIARLAHLDLDEASVEKLRLQLTTILDDVTSLNELDVSDVPPTVHPSSAEQPPRPDEELPSLDRERALANAPDAPEGLFRVPRMLGG